jgi:glutathione S-transferase
MILIGMFDSPFVRRVAVSLRLLEVPFEHRNWSAYRDFELIRQFNPLGRVPALVQPDGETLIDSSAILDFLDDSAGPERALLPPSGLERRRALHIIALALGAADKGVVLLEEMLFRPQAKSYEPRIDRFRSQMHGALAEIDRLAQMQIGEWMVAGRMTQADITLTCVFDFLCDALQLSQSWVLYPGLTALSARCGGLPTFRELRAKFTPSESALPPRHDRAAR